MNTLFKFCWDWTSMGVVEGLFVATQAELDAAYGSELDFGSVLGKYSEVRDVFEPRDITVVTTNQEFIKQFVTLIGEHGYNPLMFRVGVDLEEEPE